MKMRSLTKKLTTAAVAGAFAVSASYSALPAPSAEASLVGAAIGAVVNGTVQSVQANAMIKKYNNTEEGRQELFLALKEKYGVNYDEELNGELDRVMGNLTRAIGAVDPTVYDKPYNYFVNNEQSFNAFCTMGHNISVNSGLFRILTNEDEVAVVIGHEMGHGQKDHTAKGIRRSILPSVLASASGSILGALAANAINNQGITKPMEWEADNLAFEYITHSNYNPGACAAVWQRVIEKSKGKPNSIAQFLSGGSDHPSDKSRRDNYAKKLNEYSNKHVTVADGAVSVNGQIFASPAPVGDMSSAERAYFVAGNLAAAFHNKQNIYGATAQGRVVNLGAQPIMETVAGDEDVNVLTERLNALLAKKASTKK